MLRIQCDRHIALIFRCIYRPRPLGEGWGEGWRGLIAFIHVVVSLGATALFALISYLLPKGEDDR